MSRFIFHVQVLTLAKSLLADLVIFSTAENRDISSANNIGVEAKSSDKLLIYIRKNDGPSIQSCATSSPIAAHEEHYPFRTTLCILNIIILSKHLINYLYAGNLCAKPYQRFSIR